MSGYLSLASQLLKHHYCYACSLRDYLNNILPPSCIVLQDDDPAPYRALLNESWVASDIPCPEQVFDYELPSISQSELVGRAQLSLISRNHRSSNVMTMGYSTTGPRNDLFLSRHDRPHMINFFPNTNVTFLTGLEFQRLLQRIGSEAMFHLLLTTSIFIAAPNDCFCQIAGQPIHEKVKREPFLFQTPDVTVSVRKRKTSDDQQTKQSNKRRCVNQSDSQTSTKRPSQVSAGDILLLRSRMFYARPMTVPKTRKFLVGLPPSHALNCRKFIGSRSAADDKSRHILKHIFPLEYGLPSNLKTSHTGKRGVKYRNREVEIRLKGPQKTPKRLKPVLPLIDFLSRRHSRCRYKAMRSLTCPKKLNTRISKSLDSSVMLELMSETTTRSQASFDLSIISTVRRKRQLSSDLLSQTKPRFAEFICSHNEVYRFVSMVTRFIVPQSFWGSGHNRRIILKAVSDFIRCRRYESLSLHSILQGFRICDCEWLIPENHAAKNQRAAPSDAFKRRALLEQFVYWYFDDLVIPLLRTNFYITESSAYRNRILYFRHDDWHTLCKPLVDRLKSETFELIPQHDSRVCMETHHLGSSYIRLLPKETGVRPIVNLSRKVLRENGAWRSINDILHGAFQVLRYEQEKHPDLFTSAVWGHSDIHTKLRDFKAKLAGPQGTLPKLYFAKVDIKACFDTIEQTKLLEILSELLNEDRYMVQKYVQVAPGIREVKRSFRRNAVSETERPHFVRHVALLAQALQHTIFVDQVVYSFEDRDEIMSLLKEHIRKNILKIGDRFYRQVIGIPQGSVLSTMLCSYFYGDMERKKVAFSKDPQCKLLLRLVDDFLFITADLQKARTFLTLMKEGHPEYGCFIAKEKTLANFPLDEFDFGNILPHGERNFPWCGNYIDTEDLSVSADLTRLQNINISDTLTVERNKRPGVSFMTKMMHIVKQRSHNIYTDPSLNSEHALYLNVYQGLLICAMKMRSYLRSWGSTALQNERFITRCIRDMILFNWALLRRKWMSWPGLKRPCVFWLGYHAFIVVFNSKPMRLEGTIRCLRTELERIHLGVIRKKLINLVESALIGIDELRY